MAFDLSQHMSTSKLIRFTLPTIFMMIFTSLYTIVDGIFVSNFAGKTAFAAVNFILPFCMILASVGMMIGTGGSAIVAKNARRGRPSARTPLFHPTRYLCGCYRYGARCYGHLLHGRHGGLSRSRRSDA